MASGFFLHSGDIVTKATVDGDRVFMQDMQDCGDLLAKCAEERAQDVLRGHRKTETFRCVAELPLVLVQELKSRGMDILADKEALKRVLNDPAFAAFRTSVGRV